MKSYRRNKKKRYGAGEGRKRKPVLKTTNSLDQLHKGISRKPSAEYFEKRKVNDIPGRPKPDYIRGWNG